MTLKFCRFQKCFWLWVQFPCILVPISIVQFFNRSVHPIIAILVPIIICKILAFFMIHWREYLGLRSWHQFQTFHRHNLVFAERSLGCGQCGHMQQFPDEFMHLLGCKWWADQIKVECNGHVMAVRQRRVLTFAWKRPRCGFYPAGCILAHQH